jgi:hypothetical protein
MNASQGYGEGKIGRAENTVSGLRPRRADKKPIAS